MDRTKVFISYSRADEPWKERLMRHMMVLEEERLFHLWADTRIEIGEAWQDVIEREMAASKVAILLVTSHFLTSRFIRDEEVPRLRAHEAKGMKVLSVIGKPCAWKLVEWRARSQVRPTDGRPVSAGDDYQIDADLAGLTYEVAGIINRIEGKAGTAVAQALSETSRQVAGEGGGRVRRPVHDDDETPGVVPVLRIDEALRRLQAEASALSRAPGKGSGADAAARLFRVAIEFGVPIYNGGSPAGCALVYARAAQLACDYLAAHPASDVRDTEFRRQVQGHLAALPVQELSSIVRRDADTVAWGLRRIFDAALNAAQ